MKIQTDIFPSKATPRGFFAATIMLLSVCMLMGCNSTTTRLNGSVAGTDSFDNASDRPPTSKTLYVMSRILSGQGRDGEAEYVLVRIIHDDPSYVPAYCALAEIQIRNHKLDEATKTLNVGLGKAPRDAVILNNLGMCQVVRADYAGALDYFTRAMQADRNTPKYASNHAMALGMLGQYDESLMAYSDLVSPADAHYNIAVLCQARGDKERAAAEFAESDVLRAQEKNGGSTTQPATTQAATPVNATMPAPKIMAPENSHSATSMETADPEAMNSGK